MEKRSRRISRSRRHDMTAERNDVADNPTPASDAESAGPEMRGATGGAVAAKEAASAAAAAPSGKGKTGASTSGRRSACLRLVWWSVFGFLAACLAGTVRFFFPRALFEPKTRFTIGFPNDFTIGVSTRFQQS